MYAERHAVTITTDASGDGTGYTAACPGRIFTIVYSKDGTNPYADGVDFTVTIDGTGQTVWAELNVNATATRAPRQATHATDGTASLYAAGGEPVEDYIVVTDGDRVKIVVASGGDTKTGTFYVTVG